MQTSLYDDAYQHISAWRGARDAYLGERGVVAAAAVPPALRGVEKGMLAPYDGRDAGGVCERGVVAFGRSERADGETNDGDGREASTLFPMSRPEVR